jgi:uncharacterized protein YndB with AHSA1/START domain
MTMTSTEYPHKACRLIKAESCAVYQAFLDPDVLVRWLPPDGATGAIDIFEPHVGGRFRMRLTFVASQGKSSENTDVVEARFTDIMPNERIGLSVAFVSDDPKFAGTMTMTWQFQPTPEGTNVTVVAEAVPSGIDRAVHEAAMASSLANLSNVIGHD